jgi:hypothetical protein
MGCSSTALMTPMPRFPFMSFTSSKNLDLNWLWLMLWICRENVSPRTAMPPNSVPRWE